MILKTRQRRSILAAVLAARIVTAADPVRLGTQGETITPDESPSLTARDPAASGPERKLDPGTNRLRVIVETDAGGDPDDEQSLVRFLLYANEWDLEGVIANRPEARSGENQNPARSGLDIVRRMVEAYRACYGNLVQHDGRYPTPETLWQIVLPGYADSEAGVDRIIEAVDSPDPRPVWYSDWGSDHGSAPNNLRRALDRVLNQRGEPGYRRFKERLRLSSADSFGPHTEHQPPAFPIWVDTFRPELGGRRWYHRFSALTATAGGFEVVRDVLTGHGPLGALYPTNTTHPQKEGDSMSFLCWIPTGMNDPERPHWGSWGGRYGLNPAFPGRAYFWANQADCWEGVTDRDQTLRRWAVDLQNDFRARLDWCVRGRDGANHPPQLGSPRPVEVILDSGAEEELSAEPVSDPDGDTLNLTWEQYPEPGTWHGVVDLRPRGARCRIRAPEVTRPESIHLVFRAADGGRPSLARYQRFVCLVLPRAGRQTTSLSPTLAKACQVPEPFKAGLADPHSPLRFEDGRRVRSAADWPERAAEIRATWHRLMGPWPPLLESPRIEELSTRDQPDYRQSRVRVPISPARTLEGWLLQPRGPGPFPAVLVPYYEPDTSIGMGSPLRDFGRQLARRGFVTLSVGSPGGDARDPDIEGAACQPLSYLAYAAANCARGLAGLPNVDRTRIGVVGHSYGGKWAMFAACLYDGFACGAWSDPGIAWDESRPNVNYWDPWYLGREPGSLRPPGLPAPGNPRTGAYRQLIESGHPLSELLALMSPRPFLVSGGSEDPPERWRGLADVVRVNTLLRRDDRVAMTCRSTHDPTAESNALLYEFLGHYLAASSSARSPLPGQGPAR
jgi:hypothetical protein